MLLLYAYIVTSHNVLSGLLINRPRRVSCPRCRQTKRRRRRCRRRRGCSNEILYFLALADSRNKAIALNTNAGTEARRRRPDGPVASYDVLILYGKR